MNYLLHREQQLHCDSPTAWTFFSSPHNLSRITPRDMNFIVHTDLKEECIYEGMIIDYTVSPLLGIPMKWKTLITQVEPLQSFTDIQLNGPYKRWHHFHEFVPNGKGVLMKDTINYELPFGLIGKAAHTLLVKKRLKHLFDYRFAVIEELFNKKRKQ